MKSSFDSPSVVAISLKARGVAVGELAGRDALLDRRLLHLQPVLVGARQEEHVLAVEPLEARDRVGGDRLVGVTDMRRRRSDRKWLW